MSIELKCTYASLPKTTRGKPLIINGDPKGENMLYCNGNSVIIRNIKNPSVSDLYTEHSTQTTVAKYSPSRFYIASADSAGKIRIWDTVNKEHILKNEFQPFAGSVKDLAWSSDNTKIVVGGEGREKFGHVFNADTGTSVGEIMGVSKPLNACDFKPSRPFRIAAASEDTSIAFFEGPPFKFKLTLHDHSKFVNALKYSPSGDVFVSGGADGRAYVYDGKTAEKTGELGDPAHNGGIYALSFKPDSTQVVTASADKTAKIWDIASGSLVQEFKFENKLDNMQLACLWQGDDILTVSLSGFINYLDVDNPAQPRKIIKGHNKPITALAVSEDRTTIFTACSDGNICRWNAESGDNDLFQGKGHSAQVQSMKAVDSTLVSCGIDDCVMFTDIGSNTFGNLVKLPSQPRKLDAVSGGLVIVACINDVVVLRNGKIMFSQKVTYEPSCVTIHPGLTEVAVGGGDQTVHLYSLSNDTLTDQKQLSQNGAITAIKYSPDGAYLAAASDNSRHIFLYKCDEDYKTMISSEWGYHTARVNSMDWSSDSARLATAGLDCNLRIFTVAQKSKIIKCDGAHKMANITNVRWLNDNSLVSVAQDSNMKVWNVKF